MPSETGTGPDDGGEGTDSSTTSADTSADDTTTGGSTTSDESCIEHADCRDPAIPICNPNGICIACSDSTEPNAACESLDPAFPVCAGNVCSECSVVYNTCSGSTPICDATLNECRPCREHSDCPMSACKVPSSFDAANDDEPDVGTCFDPDDVVDVANGALLYIMVGNQPAGSDRVYRLENGSYPTGTVGISVLGKTVALLAAENVGSAGLSAPANPAPTIRVEQGGRLFLYGLELDNNSSPMARAVYVVDGRVQAQRTRIHDNLGGAVSAVGELAYADLENCFLKGSAGAAAVQSYGGNMALLYSTAYRPLHTNGAVLTCTADSQLNITNSLIVNNDNVANVEIDCPVTASTIVDSAVETNTSPEVWFTNPDGNNLYLNDGHPFEDIAVWHTGHPTVDIQGSARPDVDGTPDVAGAHNG